jgi:predicted secreted protein
VREAERVTAPAETEDDMERGTRRGLVAAAAALALGAALLGGCGGGTPAEGSSPSTIRVTPAAKTGTTVDARVGDTVVVSVEANETTGYQWTFTAGETFTVDKSEYVPDPNPDQLAGKGGTQVVTLTVTKAGESDLLGTYARSWETPAPGAGPDLTVTVKSVD